MAMETRDVYVCESCKSIFEDVNDVRVFQGNVYVGDGQGGLIGNNIEDGTVEGVPNRIKAVHSTMYCRQCCKNILRLEKCL